MDRLTLALTVAFIVIGTVLAGVWALARLGSRAMLHPPSARTLRRLGMAMAAVGALVLVIAVPIAVVIGDVGRLLVSLVQGIVSLVAGINFTRQYPPGE